MKHRRQGVNIEVPPFIVTVNQDEAGKHEVFIVSRAKLGHDLDHILHDLGIKISRALQGKDV